MESSLCKSDGRISTASGSVLHHQTIYHIRNHIFEVGKFLHEGYKIINFSITRRLHHNESEI